MDLVFWFRIPVYSGLVVAGLLFCGLVVDYDFWFGYVDGVGTLGSHVRARFSAWWFLVFGCFWVVALALRLLFGVVWNLFVASFAICFMWVSICRFSCVSDLIALRCFLWVLGLGVLQVLCILVVSWCLGVCAWCVG